MVEANYKSFDMLSSPSFEDVVKSTGYLNTANIEGADYYEALDRQDNTEWYSYAI